MTQKTKQSSNEIIKDNKELKNRFKFKTNK